MSTLILSVEVPIELPSRSNDHRSNTWHARKKLVARQRQLVGLWLRQHAHPGLPVTVVMTRLAARKVDQDNLRGALKAVQDEIAAWLGVDDRDERVRFLHEQGPAPKSSGQAVRIDVHAGQPCCPACGAPTVGGRWVA